MNRNFLKLFENCRIVKGAKRAIVCDLQRNKFVFIPLGLADLFDEDNLLEVQSIKSKLEEHSLAYFDEYLSLLKQNEFVFACSKTETKLFPKLDMAFDYPATISNMVIDYNKNSNPDFDRILEKFIIPSNCRHIELRFFDEIEFDFLIDLMKSINASFIKSVQFFVKDSCDFNYEMIVEWTKKNKKIVSLTLHSSTEDGILNRAEHAFGTVTMIKQKIDSTIHCGNIHHTYFNMMMESFTESQHHNSCLNRKLSIDVNGNIKNCPSMPESFGNIKDTTLEEALDKPGFKKYWNITKDQIEVCKDCEFRHVCTDCRAYTERTKFKDDIDLSKPLKCGYNPYTNEWAEWSTNPLKEKAIAYYGMEGLVKKKK